MPSEAHPAVVNAYALRNRSDIVNVRQPVPRSKDSRVGAASQVELGQDAAHVVSDRMRTENQALCDFEIGEAFCDQQKYFVLAFG